MSGRGLYKKIYHYNMEPLDLNNVIEVQQIKQLIKPFNKLTEFFDELIEKINKQINSEKQIQDIKLEDYITLELSDHSSDDD